MPCQTSMMELFYQNNHFYKKSPTSMFDMDVVLMLTLITLSSSSIVNL